MAFPLPRGKRVRVRGKKSSDHPHLNPPPSRGRIFLRIWIPRSRAAGYFIGANHLCHKNIS